MNEDPNAKLIRELKEEVERLRQVLRAEGLANLINEQSLKRRTSNTNEKGKQMSSSFFMTTTHAN